MTELDANSTVVSILVNWNNSVDTLSCLNNLQSQNYDNHAIVIIDNNSEKEEVAMLEESISKEDNIKLIKNQVNEGYGKGINQAIDHAQKINGDYIWVLNSDIMIEDNNILSGLVDIITAGENISAVSPIIREYPSERIWFRKGILDTESGMAGHEWYFPIKNLLKTTIGINKGLHEAGELIENSYIPFCSVLISYDAIESAGYLSEDYFLYYADVDYCMKLSNNNQRLITHTDLEIDHKVSMSSGGQASPTSSYYNARNRWIFKRNHSDAVTYKFYTSYIFWFCTRIVNRLIHRNFSSVKAMIEGLVDGLLDKRGKGRFP
jgi:GT2 family glycosyltransferase